jgi:RIO kinase 2
MMSSLSSQYMDAVKATEGEGDEEGSDSSENEEELVSESEPVPEDESSDQTFPAPEVCEQVASVSLSDPYAVEEDAKLPQQHLESGDSAAIEELGASSSSGEEEDDVKTRVANEIGKTRVRQQKKYHSKKSAGRAGRAKGSKVKQDTRVHLDGGW